MRLRIFIIVLVGILFSQFALSGTLMALQGNVLESGSALASGDLRVEIYDSMEGGNLIYNSSDDFDGAVSQGKYDVLLGSGSQNLTLNYGEIYYLELYVNGEKFTFDGENRQMFQSSFGEISSMHINWDGDVELGGYSLFANTLGIIASGFEEEDGDLNIALQLWTNIDDPENKSGLGLYNPNDNYFVWAVVEEMDLSKLRVDTKYLFVGNGDFTGDFRADGDIYFEGDLLVGGNITAPNFYNKTAIDSFNLSKWVDDLGDRGYNHLSNFTNDLNIGNWTADKGDYARLDGANFSGEVHFNGDFLTGGVSIIDGDLFAQRIFVYNISSLEVSHLNVNGSLIPLFNNQFDIGNESLRYKNAYFSGNVFADNLYNQTEVDEFNLSKWVDDLGNRGYTHLSNFTDNLGDRGYNHLSNFTNNLNIGNWTADKGDYYTKLQVYNKSEVDVLIAGAGDIGGTISTGQVAFGNGSDVIGGSSNLYWNNANGRLGIGTSSPQNVLHIRNSSDGEDEYSGLRFTPASTGTANHAISGFRAGGLRLSGGQTGGNTLSHIILNNSGITFGVNTLASMNSAMFINQDGKVGIGTISPNALLHVNTATAQPLATIGRDSIASGDYAIAMGQNVNATGTNSVAIGKDSRAEGLRSIAIGTGAVATHTNSMVIGLNPSGDTTSTAGTLTVGGDVKVTGTTNSTDLWVNNCIRFTSGGMICSA